LQGRNLEVTKKTKVAETSSFTLPLWPPVIFGIASTVAFYGMIMGGPLDNAWMRRYFLGHWVCVATVALFLVSLWSLSLKTYLAFRQKRLMDVSVDSLKTLIAVPEQVEPLKRSHWLLKLWGAQPNFIRHSWFGQRVEAVVKRQSLRTSGVQLDDDLKEVSQLDGDRQHDSYGMIRIAVWAMPMLGFLGTVLGISQTLGAMDMKLLASQSQDVMNQLTSGLYVAFDTTALALSLTVVAMYIQFGVQRLELAILGKIDHEVGHCLMGFLIAPEQSEAKAVELHWKQLSAELVGAVQLVVQQQAMLWKQTIQEAHQHWANLTGAAGDQIQRALEESIQGAMHQHAETMGRIQREGVEQIESRWQQWQMVLSDQARSLHGQQKEMAKQAELLHRLVQSGGTLNRLEDELNSNIEQLTQVDRFHEAALCLTEAIAVLATQIERSGILERKSDASRGVGSNETGIVEEVVGRRTISRVHQGHPAVPRAKSDRVPGQRPVSSQPVDPRQNDSPAADSEAGTKSPLKRPPTDREGKAA
jgi:biopolymer transport protein ExbB/TolQ